MRRDGNSVLEVFVGVVYPKTLRDVQYIQTLFTLISSLICKFKKNQEDGFIVRTTTIISIFLFFLNTTVRYITSVHLQI